MENWFTVSAIILSFISFIISFCFSYNNLQSLGEIVKEHQSIILATMEKRANLINILLDLIQSYTNHEKVVYMSISKRVALSEVYSVALNYPELKANETYQHLMDKLHVIENELQQKRETYNHVVQLYNSTRLKLPTVLYVRLLGFKEAPYFNFDEIPDIKEINNTRDEQMLNELFFYNNEKQGELSDTRKSLLDRIVAALTDKAK